MSRRLIRPAAGLLVGLSLSLLPQTGAADDANRLETQLGAPALLSPHITGNEPILVSDESGDLSAPEIIRERYANRAVKIERQVVQDDAGNYMNHGPWTMWDETGRMLGTGQYVRGERSGRWTRWFAAGEGELFQGEVYQQFQAPFVSQVTLEAGELHGAWAIMDAQKREVSMWEFRDGKRHGKSVWWYPNGQKWREVDYRDGVVDGLVMEWAADGTLARKDAYVEGRRLGTQVEWFAPGVKKLEAEYLFAEEVYEASDDWWNGQTQVREVGTEGQDERHGLFVSWDRNGQKVLEGRYHLDEPVGTFVWWHSNGQKAIEGTYVDGQQQGTWTWWHENGQKQIAGSYEAGEQSGAWSWWDVDGKSIASAIYADEGSQLADDALDPNAGEFAMEPFIEEPALIDAPPAMSEPPSRGPVRLATPPNRLVR